MNYTVNGEQETAAQAPSVAAIVDKRFSTRDGIAVAVGGAVVARSAWESRVLADGDSVDILTAVQGG